MTYPAPFHRIVMIGSLYADIFNVTLSMVPAGGATLPAVSQSLADAVGAVCADWWNNNTATAPATGIGIINSAALRVVKVNRIGTNGKYQDPVAREYALPTPVIGSSSGTAAAQLSLAVTLRGFNERARAGRGRMYFPPSDACLSIGADGRVTTSAALKQAQGVNFLLGAIDDVYIAQGVSAVAGIASNVGAGAFQSVLQTSAGRVVDTIRSRRSALDEDPQYWGAP